jgi:exodeoxyribonuclease VII small subunit
MKARAPGTASDVSPDDGASEGRSAVDGSVRFEAALARLEALVEELDGGELDLEDSLAKFEEGIRLVRFCSDRLAGAKLRITELERSAEGLSERPLSLEESS